MTPDRPGLWVATLPEGAPSAIPPITLDDLDVEAIARAAAEPSAELLEILAAFEEPSEDLGRLP